MAAHLFPVIFILVTVYHCACVNSALADGGVEDEDRKRGKNNLSNDREDSGVFHDLGRKDSESLDSLNSTLTPDRVTNVRANVSEDGNGPNVGTQKKKRKKNDKGKNIQQPTDPNVKPKGKNLTKTTDQNVKSRDKKKPSKDQLEEWKKNLDITKRLRSLPIKDCPCDNWKPVITPTLDPSGTQVSVEFCDNKRKLIDDVRVWLWRQNESTMLNNTLLKTPSCQINYTLEKGDYFIQLRGDCLGCGIKNGFQGHTDVITSETFTVNESVKLLSECPCKTWKPVITTALDLSGTQVSVEFCDQRSKRIGTVEVCLVGQIESTKLIRDCTKLIYPSCQTNYTDVKKGDYKIELKGDCPRYENKNGYKCITGVFSSGNFTVTSAVIITPDEERDDLSLIIVVGVLAAVVCIGGIVSIPFVFRICKGKELVRASSPTSPTSSQDLQTTTVPLLGTPKVPNVSADSLAKCDRCDSICESDHVVSRQADHSATPVSSRHASVTGQKSLTDTGLRVHKLLELPKTETHDQSFDGKALVEHELKVFHCPAPSLSGSCFTLTVVDMCGTSTSACSPDAISDKNHGLTLSSGTYDAHDSCTYDAHDSCTYDAHDSMSGETFEAFIKRDMNQPKFGILRQPNAQGKKPFSVSLPYRLLGLKQFDTKC